MSSKKSGGAVVVRPITPGWGVGTLTQLFGGKPFIHCLIEMIKNARDYRAQIIAVSFLGRDRLRMLDNGNGMGATNRDSFLSVNMTSATRRDQSARFGSGTKHMLYSHATQVEVVTACDEEPEWVYRFSFTTASYEEMVMKKQSIIPERLPKTAETWPHADPFGTQITYTLADPKSRGILRGETLAAELAARLPLKFRDIVMVDSKPIPEKKLVGRAFIHTENHPKLGLISVELYRPERRRSDEDLRLAVVEVGETSMRNVFRVLGDVGDLVPTVYRLDMVCGTLTAPYFRDYANEDRTTVSPTIADDTNIMAFVRFLERIAPQVAQALELKLDAESEDAADQAAMDELRAMVTSAYGTEVGDKTPPHNPDGTEPPPGAEDLPPGEQNPIGLSLRHEFEPGEVIDLKVHLRGEVAQRYGLDALHWHTARANAIDIRKVADGLRMTADKLGRGVISADIPNTPYSNAAQYDVVAKRVFRLSTSHADLVVGTRLMLLGVNIDRLKGKLVWKHTGVGRLEPEGGRATYTATQPGDASITAYGADDPTVQAGCLIRVRPTDDQVIRIRQVAFSPRWMGGSARMRPVTMSKGTNVHPLTVCNRARGFKEARERGNLPLFLAMATAFEFARFDRLVLNAEDSVDQRDPGAMQDEIQAVAYEVLEEILGAKK